MSTTNQARTKLQADLGTMLKTLTDDAVMGIGNLPPTCGHSACSQHYIDTGSADCIVCEYRGCNAGRTVGDYCAEHADQICPDCGRPYDEGCGGTSVHAADEAADHRSDIDRGR